MLRRTRVEEMVFPNPFQVEGYEKQIPAGTYSILIKEELIQGLSFKAYRRTSTTLLIPGSASRPGGTLFISAAQAHLDDAQRVD